MTSLETTLSHTPPRERYNNILSNNFRKLKRIAVIFAKQHQRNREKLIVERKSMSLLYPAKWNTLWAVTQQHQKGTKFQKESQKSVSAYCWVVHSSSKSWYKSY